MSDEQDLRKQISVLLDTIDAMRDELKRERSDRADDARQISQAASVGLRAHMNICTRPIVMCATSMDATNVIERQLQESDGKLAELQIAHEYLAIRNGSLKLEISEAIKLVNEHCLNCLAIRQKLRAII